MFPFDDGKKLEDYSQADWEELLEANFNEREDRLLEEVPASFYQSLPQELQKAYEYVANGGTDLKNMFRALAAAEEVKQLDVSSEEGQEDSGAGPGGDQSKEAQETRGMVENFEKTTITFTWSVRGDKN